MLRRLAAFLMLFALTDSVLVRAALACERAAPAVASVAESAPGMEHGSGHMHHTSTPAPTSVPTPSKQQHPPTCALMAVCALAIGAATAAPMDVPPERLAPLAEHHAVPLLRHETPDTPPPRS